MKREEQIINAAKEFWMVEDSIVDVATFQKGAEWADNHPPFSISSILRIIEAGQEGNMKKLENYSKKLADYMKEAGFEKYAKMIETKFNPNAVQIIFDNFKNE